jgi:hypothetical protein
MCSIARNWVGLGNRGGAEGFNDGFKICSTSASPLTPLRGVDGEKDYVSNARQENYGCFKHCPVENGTVVSDYYHCYICEP